MIFRIEGVSQEGENHFEKEGFFISYRICIYFFVNNSGLFLGKNPNKIFQGRSNLHSSLS